MSSESSIAIFSLISFHLCHDILFLDFHGIFIILIEENLLKFDLRFDIEFDEYTFDHREYSRDLLIHG